MTAMMLPLDLLHPRTSAPFGLVLTAPQQMEVQEEEGPIGRMERRDLLLPSEFLPACLLPLQEDIQALPEPTIIRTVHLLIIVSIAMCLPWNYKICLADMHIDTL